MGKNVDLGTPFSNPICPSYGDCGLKCDEDPGS